VDALKQLASYWEDGGHRTGVDYVNALQECADQLMTFIDGQSCKEPEDLTAIIGDDTKADISADRNWIAGAQWGFGRGLENDNASLAEAIEARQRDIKAAKAIIGEGD